MIDEMMDLGWPESAQVDRRDYCPTCTRQLQSKDQFPRR